MGAPISNNLQPDSGSDSDSDLAIDTVPIINWTARYEEQRRERLRQEAMQVGSPFPHPWFRPYTDVGPSARCLDEWLLIEVSASIRSKPDWKRKYKDKKIVKKWKQEIRQQCKDKTVYIEDIIEYLFKELEWYEELETRWMGSSGFEISFNDYIVSSDSAIALDIKEKLKNEVSKLVQSFGNDLDYHPGSDEKVIDLVHPSLFLLQYDKTPIINDNIIEIVKFKEEIQYAKKQVESYGVSKRFQWLPSLLNFEEGRFTFNSYINNLHPIKHKGLYESIENIFNAIIPGLSYTLTRYASKEYIRINVPPGNQVYTEEYYKISDDLWERIDNEGEDQEEIQKQIDVLESDKSLFIVEVKPKWDQPPEFDHIIDVKSFENLKVVVKLANIELTPEKPSYAGGSWHVEGTINEDIIATVLYYYDMDNISESRLSFRTAFEDPSYDQGDHFYNHYFYGIKDGDVMVKDIGSVEAKEDRIVIFPNMYQHHVDPFELKDKTKPGYRKILCFFICDPYNTNVMATDKVPPQQEDWWNDPELNYLYPGNIKEQILQLKDDTWPMNLQEAKSVRRELMSERTASIVDEYDEIAFQRHFSLCEH